METFRKGDIVIFPFPYTDLSEKKLRPCLVISDVMQDDLMLCQITSNNSRKDKYSIGLGSTETIDGTLSIDSLIRTNMIFTASIEQIKKKICRIDKKKYSEVAKKIQDIIEI